MSLNKLVGGDCGGNNSLVQLSNIIGRDAASSQPPTMAEQYVSEFMAQNNANRPQTFNMNNLLNSMPETMPHNNAQISMPETMLHNNAQIRPGPSSSNSQMGWSWMPGPSTAFIPQQPMFGNFIPVQGGPLAIAPGVQIQYIKESEMQNNDVRAKAQEYVSQIKEEDNLAYNQFMSFMEKISAAEINFEPAQHTESEMNREQLESMDKIRETYKAQWNKLHDVDLWDPTNGIASEYEFSVGNVMLENKSALELGKERLKMGDVPGAVICFEAAAQQEPNSAAIWFLLGSTQAENEQDPMAITALRKCIELDPSMQEAYLILAAAFTNENMPLEAHLSLLDWLKNSPKYKNLASINIETSDVDLSELQMNVRNMYLNAARQSPNQIDADIQNALGVAFNISQEYDKAVDCFKTALMVQGNNPQLWNRLGATLANSNRSEEAVDAYHEALNLEPGFVRARYNVGVTCMNLGAHKQAAEHFLVALNQQKKAENMGPESMNFTSPAIWTTLRMVCSSMGEHEVAELVDQKNLTELNKFFKFDA